NELVAKAKLAQPALGNLTGAQRATLLHQIGAVLETNREYLIEVAMAEAGKTFDQVDVEVSEAIDFAHYYAHQAKRLDALPGAKPKPRPVTLVAPPWNFPI
ncbi:MAG: aldehyde dehydrogenase family protein, partial [Aquiluna sp.]